MFNNWKDSLFTFVDPFLSEITVEPDTLPADGTSNAMITISPKNNSDTLLASGLQVVLSNTGAGLLSSVTDLGDGTYEATITAPISVGTDTISPLVISGIDSVSIFWKAVVTYIDPTYVNESFVSLDEFYLYQNYPQPFNPSTTIKFQIPKTSFVSLKIFDAIGTEVAILVDEVKIEGTFQVEFDGSGLTSGVYFYQLMAGDFFETKKMVLIK